MNDHLPSSVRRVAPAASVLVLGLGNPLMGDDGAGLLLLDALREVLPADDRVVLEEGGTLGMTLLPLIEDARAVMFLDATHTGEAPGSVVVRCKDELPGFFSHILSPHQIGLREVLGAAQLCGTLPEQLALVGIETESVAFGQETGEAVRKALPEAVRTARQVLAGMLDILERSEPQPARAGHA